MHSGPTNSIFTSLLFRIGGDSYHRVIAWQRDLDQAILRCHLDTRVQAQAVASAATSGLGRADLPGPGLAEPYYGTIGGAYQYKFHPLVGGCQLEVIHQAGGAPIPYPDRFEPLQLFLFEPVEQSELGGGHATTADLCEQQYAIFKENPRAMSMQFLIPPSLYGQLNQWTWFRRVLSAYDFIFIPTSTRCLARVVSRDSGSALDLTPGFCP